MKSALLFFLAFVLCSMVSCRRSDTIQRYEFASQIDSLIQTYNSGDKVINDPQLCELFPEDWDSLVILKPYDSFGQLQTLHLSNLEALDQSLSTEHSDEFCVLLFIKERVITGYSKIKRMPLDFSTMTMTGTGKSIEKGACSEIYLQKTPENRPAYQVKIQR